MEYTQKDKDFINSQWRETINSLREDYNKWENHTLKEYVIKCADLAERMIEYKTLELEKTDISSYLFNEFIKEGIEISQRTVQRSLPSDYKRNYLESDTLSQLNDPDWTTKTDKPDLFVQQDQFGNYRINGIEQRPIPETHDKKETDSKNPKNTKDDKITKILDTARYCGGLIDVIFGAFLDKYNESEEYEKLIRDHFKDKSEFYVEQYAILRTARSEIDDRNKWGDYEKILSKFLIDTGESTARIAELLNYSSKYGSIGIDRHEEFVDPQTKQFKKQLLEFLMRCPNCHDNIYHKINEDIEKYRKGIEMEIQLPL